MSGNKIYDSLTRLDDPVTAVVSLLDSELKALVLLLRTLPDCGVPMIFKAIAGEEVESRWMLDIDQLEDEFFNHESN